MEADPEILRRGYWLDVHIGRGGFGELYRATDERSGQLVAIKIALAGDPEAQKRAMREFAVLRRLRHPNVGGVREAFEVRDGRLCLVLDWIDGIPLTRLLEQRGPHQSEPDAIACTRALLGALDAAHRTGILHRDIKPSNVIVPLVDGEPHWPAATLIDFGAAGMLLRGGTTIAGEIFGTPRYMAPEQIRGQRQSPATDVYGVGLLTFRMLYGRLPFGADSHSIVELAQAILEEALVIPEAPPVSHATRRFLRAALARDPSERPVSAAAALALLPSPEARPQRAAAPAPAPPPPPVLLDETWTSESRPASRHPAPAPHPPEPFAYDRTITLGAPRSARPRLALAASAAFGVAVIGLASVLAFHLGDAPVAIRPYLDGIGAILLAGLAAGAAGGLFGVATWRATRRLAAARGGAIERAAEVDFFAGQLDEVLERSLALRAQELYARTRDADERVLAVTVGFMARQLSQAGDFQERRDVVREGLELLERIKQRRTPWYVRHEKLVAFVGSVVAVASSGVAVIAGIRSLIAGF